MFPETKGYHFFKRFVYDYVLEGLMSLFPPGYLRFLPGRATSGGTSKASEFITLPRNKVYPKAAGDLQDAQVSWPRGRKTSWMLHTSYVIKFMNYGTSYHKVSLDLDWRSRVTQRTEFVGLWCACVTVLQVVSPSHIQTYTHRVLQ